MATVMVAMSGGVDSSLVAALLHEQGHQVTGVTMHLWEGDDQRRFESQCCSQEMTEGARRVCRTIGVPYYVFNYQREFRRHVISYFINEYVAGATPNPCLACNRDLKFRYLLERAQTLGFDYLATGHYVRRLAPGEAPNPGETFQLRRAVDHAKDQSYVLYMLQQSELQRLLFPLGGYTKAEVRAMARTRGLSTADRPESQDICFIPDRDYRRFLREEAADRFASGPIVDTGGRVLGQHQGLPLYTIGQRRGLGITTPQPMFVVALDTGRNTLVVGTADELERPVLEADRVSFVAGGWPQAPFDCQAQIRAHAAPLEALVTPLEPGQIRVAFARPQRAVTPGQAVVLYDGDILLGGGRIR